MEAGTITMESWVLARSAAGVRLEGTLLERASFSGTAGAA